MAPHKASVVSADLFLLRLEPHRTPPGHPEVAKQEKIRQVADPFRDAILQ